MCETIPTALGKRGKKGGELRLGAPGAMQKTPPRIEARSFLKPLLFPHPVGD